MKKKVPFEDLNVGDEFEFNETKFMRTSSTTSNAIHVSGKTKGKLSTFCPETLVDIDKLPTFFGSLKVGKSFEWISKIWYKVPRTDLAEGDYTFNAISEDGTIALFDCTERIYEIE